ncbi:uncharacterized protein RJT21DRAFT_122193 [Scheffersomyces amazonensis]|uniref:uncharacterized protein n=1 Tax=Scheffersomyces amazonensis TaxID=1078765 RepID=UPI00315C95F9
MSVSDRVTKLVEWSTLNGAKLSSNLEIKPVADGNIGVFYHDVQAANEEEDDDGQIKLPLNLVITLQTAIESFSKLDNLTSYQEITQKTSNINSLLKLYLARERQINDSFFSPYIQLLPTLFQINSPYTWKSSDKELLKGTNLGNSLPENIQQLVEEWWQIINLIPDTVAKPTEHFINMKFYYEYKFYKNEDFDKYFEQEASKVENWTSFPNYLWASLILKSRSFPTYLLKESIKRDIKQDEAMLLPLVDLLNHDPKAKVNWLVDSNSFTFKSDNPTFGDQLYNNYGMKGNEELLLAYGFALENNIADSVALKIKVPLEMVQEIKDFGITLPSIHDYTTSIVRISSESDIQSNDIKQYTDGILYFISKDNLPSNLIELFQFLVKNRWENNGVSLRMKLAGYNHLRAALENKMALLNNKIPKSSANHDSILTYINSQTKIYQEAIKKIKHLEKDLIAENKSKLISLKSVYKKDKKFQQSLLIHFGFSSYESILEAQFQDQAWLLYLIRCVNREEYIPNAQDNLEGDENNYLPKWIHDDFKKLQQQVDISNEEVLQYQQIYQNLIPELNTHIPEIYNKGNWTVENLVYSAKLLDILGFVRGKDQECILVKH